MNRLSLVAVLVAGTLPFSIGCASKKYVRNQAAPTVNKVNELDDLTAKTTNEIRDVDQRAQSGIKNAQAQADQADQHAESAGQAANQAQQLASTAVTSADQLSNTVVNLDNYKPISETQVHFAFDKYNLTKKAREALDQGVGNELPNAKHYIVVVDGNTDSVGPASYNYLLSKRRADTVIHYLLTKYNLPSYKIYTIGFGKDKPTAPNSTVKGRAENRRVTVRLMTNINDGATTQASVPQQQ